MAFDHETAETIAPVLAIIGQEARLDPNWTCHMLEAVAGQVLPDFHRRQRNNAACNADRISHGERVIANETPAIDDLVQLSHAYAAEECLIEALYRISMAVELQPKNGELLRLKASILERMGRFEEALHAAQQAKELGVEPDAISADIDRINGQHVAHLEAMAEQLLPSIYRQRRSMAVCGAERIRIGMKLASSAEVDVDDLVQLAHACAAEEMLADALYWMGKAIELKPDQGEHLRFKASILERMGRFEGALQVANDARILGSDTESISFDAERIEAQLVCHLAEVSSCLDTAASLPASVKLLCMGRLTFPEFINLIGKIVRAYANKN